MNPNLDSDYNQFVQFTASCNNMTKEYISYLWVTIYESAQQNWYSKPMPWIGIYIALASLFCIFAMVADLLHGFHSKKLWFPCNYFTLNAASLTLIGVAIKLPMDLTNLMPGDVDRTAKLGSLSFMCTMMVNLLPSLATMDNKSLVSNMIALGILVITLVVNVCIQINTGLLSYREEDVSVSGTYPQNLYVRVYRAAKGQEFIASIYVGMLLMLLMIYVCSSLAIVKCKQILESKYQEAHQAFSKDPKPLQKFEMVKQHVSNYWIMAETGSPQFMVVCSPTTSASWVICALSTGLHIYMVRRYITDPKDYSTSYKWTMPVILVIQFIAVIVGTVASFSRCFGALSFKLSRKWIWNRIKVFRVESYWTRKLSDWEMRISIPFPFDSLKGKIVIRKLKVLFFSICIGFQKIIVVACKMIAIIPLLFLLWISYCLRCWKWLKAVFCASGIVLESNLEHQRNYEDRIRYILQLQDDMEYTERTLKGILESVYRLIYKAGKKQPNDLIKLLAQSSGFEGVAKYDSHHVPSLLAEEYLNCWSLPLVTLTTIAMSFPDIPKDITDGLLISVREGLTYVKLVEESLNATEDNVSIQKVAKTLWVDVLVWKRWLGKLLPIPVNTPEKMLQWLRDTSKNIVTEVESMDIGVSDDDSKYRSISANSMYRITETLMLSYHENFDHVSQEELFARLTSMIADILAASLTNLPQIIAMKCHAKKIEKRKASVSASAQLFGETTQIITFLQDRVLPRLSRYELAYIDKWRSYFKKSSP